MTSVLTSKGDKVELTTEKLDELKAGVRGEIILPMDAGYDEARKIWNAMIDRKPGLIVVCTGHADVVACVKYALKHSLLISVRGGGHNIAGKSLKDDAMLIDLSKWRNVHVKGSTVSVAPGATLGDIDHETKEYGLALNFGINSTTGISGLTLGGGYGWLSKKFGMTIDSLLSAVVVVASGETLYCDEERNPDLFWALRGGNGNFGIVTNFEFKLHKCGPMITAGPIIYPIEQAKDVLKKFADESPKASEDLNVWVIIRMCPPFPFIPESHHMKPVLILAACYIGEDAGAEAAIKPFKELGTPLGVGVGPVPLAGWNAAFDPLLTPGARNYWKTCNMPKLSPDMLEIYVDKACNPVNFGTESIIGVLGGAISRVDPSTTAYAHRNVALLLNCHTRWEKPEEDEDNINFARGLISALEPYTDGTTYSNFVSEADESTEAVYGKNLAKIQSIKAKYDPNNFFSVNYNVRPTV